MANRVDVILGEYRKADWPEVLSSAPAGIQGRMYINSTDHGLYIYYGNNWQLMATLAPTVVVPPVTGNPIGLLLSLTYQI